MSAMTTSDRPDPQAALAAAQAAVEEAEQRAATLAAAHDQRRQALADVEATGLNLANVRDLTDQVRLTDPAAAEDAREELLTARLAAVEAERLVRHLDLPAAQKALDEAEQHARAAVLAVQEARWRVQAARGHDLAAEARDLRTALTNARTAHAAARRQRLATLTGTATTDGEAVVLSLANDSHSAWT
mgnify:CR=1 FL=1